jgi:predicted NAD/FAD-dependent oxidoreductase
VFFSFLIFRRAFLQGQRCRTDGVTPDSWNHPDAALTTAMRVLIVGSGLTGSLTCYHLRQKCKHAVIHVADMARGAGGRMSTTRFGVDAIKANTGAQYISCYSPEAMALLEKMCNSNGGDGAPCCYLDRVNHPLKRSTHFVLKPDKAYTHWLPREGTNTVVKQFLFGGAPDMVAFESRLQSITKSGEMQLCPQFDRGGGLSSSYDAIVLAMPPKDIQRFFNNVSRSDLQSQADLHRQTNRGKTVSQGHQRITLPPDVLRRMRSPSYNGRYSLALWFQDHENCTFVSDLLAAWRAQQEPHAILDMISPQQGVLVVQSTVELWDAVESGGGRGGKGGKSGRGRGKGTTTNSLSHVQGGGRNAARSHITAAMEKLAGYKMPRAQHAKLLNWRTSQVSPPLQHKDGPTITAEGGRLIFTGDWFVESSFEGCNLAAQAAATAAAEAISNLK